MIRKTTWVFLAVFAIALSLIWVIPWIQAKSPKTTPTPTAAPKPLLGSSTIEISTLKITDASGNQLVANQKNVNGTNQWVATESEGKKITSDQIDQAITSIKGMTIDNELNPQPASDVIGLSTPAFTIVLTTNQNAERVIKVGNVTPTEGGYYVQVDSNPAVVVNKYSLDTVVDLLKSTQTPEATTPTTPTEEITLPVETNTAIPEQTITTPVETTVTPTP